MPADELLYLLRADVESFDLDARTITGLLEQAFLEKGRGNAETPLKL